MRPVKSRRETYSEATRAALLEEATRLFADRGFAGTSLEDVAAATQVTRGAVYHHFSNKKALFEAVLEEQESRAMQEVVAAATDTDIRQAALQALGSFLDHCCDPVYGRLCWEEGPAALGLRGWKALEEKHAYGVVEQFIEALMAAGYVERKAQETTTQFFFWMLGGAGIDIGKASDEDRQRVRAEWYDLMVQALNGLMVRR